MVKKIVCIFLVIGLVFSMTSCSGETGVDSNIETEEMVIEEDVEKFSLTKPPSEEFIVETLESLPTVIGVEAAYDDPEKVEGTVAEERIVTVYFSSSLVNQDDFSEDQTIAEKGTASGGSIEIFPNTGTAEARDSYLEEHNNSWKGMLINSGSHKVYGTLVIRASAKLESDEQKLLEDAVIAKLQGLDVPEKLSERASNTDVELNDNNKEQIEEEIEELNEGEVKIPKSAYFYENKDKDEVVKLLRDIGFKNIDKKPVYDLGLGAFDKTELNEVETISIAGNDEFVKDDIFNKTDKVVIKYHLREMDNPNITYKTRTVDQLIDELESNALRATENYEDEYVKIKGRVELIDSNGKYIDVFPINDKYAFSGVSCDIRTDDQKDKLMKLSKGDIVTIKGKITLIGEFIGYTMDVYTIIIE